MIEAAHTVTNGFIIVVEGKESLDNFKELVNRATNLWPDAPAEIKIFADIITNSDWHPQGPLQDYTTQDTSPGTKEFFRSDK